MKVTVHVRRRPQIADPQGSTVERALRELGYADVADVRIDRTITLSLDEQDRDQANTRVTEMCEKLLANPVMEDFEIVFDE